MSLVTKILRPWWRLTRGMTLGAQAAVFDADGRVLLIRHGYRPGWHFPGGGAEWNEPLEVAMRRELREETGVVAEGKAELHGMFANFKAFPNDHIALYVVRQWSQPVVPRPNMEIAEQKFFAADEWPEGLNRGTFNRLQEIEKGKAVSPYWTEAP